MTQHEIDSLNLVAAEVANDIARHSNAISENLLFATILGFIITIISTSFFILQWRTLKAQIVVIESQSNALNKQVELLQLQSDDQQEIYRRQSFAYKREKKKEYEILQPFIIVKEFRPHYNEDASIKGYSWTLVNMSDNFHLDNIQYQGDSHTFWPELLGFPKLVPKDEETSQWINVSNQRTKEVSEIGVLITIKKAGILYFISGYISGRGLESFEINNQYQHSQLDIEPLHKDPEQDPIPIWEPTIPRQREFK